jgi:DNA repair protein RadC
MDVKNWSNEEILAAAASILEERAATYATDLVSTPEIAKEIACHRLGTLEHEVFAVFWLDVQNRVIEFEQIFRGTLSQTSVYPREIAKSALRHNAAGAILAHNHPSGTLEPSSADQILTRVIKEALALLDVRVLDHLIVSGNRTRSMAELGYV